MSETSDPSSAGKQRTCFVITPIGAPHTPVNDHANEVLGLIINPVLADLADLNFGEAIRADKLGQPGMVTHQILDLIWNADLVIADLSFGNPNVFYELALRHGLRKPFVQIALSGSPLPFDVAGLRTIMFDRTRWGDIEQTKRELRVQITNVMAGKPVVTPLTHYFTTQALEAQGGLGAAVSQVIQTVDELSGQMTSVIGQLGVLRDASFIRTVGYPTGPLGPQGAQGAQFFAAESAGGSLNWGGVRPAAIEAAQRFANQKIGRNLNPDELEAVLMPVRQRFKQGAVRKATLHDFVQAQVAGFIEHNSIPKQL